MSTKVLSLGSVVITKSERSAGLLSNTATAGSMSALNSDSGT